jgi:hypothetical protein
MTAVAAHHHRKPRTPLYRRAWRAVRTGQLFPAAWRARRDALDAELDAYAAPVQGPQTLAQAAEAERGFAPLHHAPGPLLARRLEAAAAKGLAAWDELPPATGPLPAAMQDTEDDRQLWNTGQFALDIGAMGGE